MTVINSVIKYTKLYLLQLCTVYSNRKIFKNTKNNNTKTCKKNVQIIVHHKNATKTKKIKYNLLYTIKINKNRKTYIAVRYEK